MNARPLTFNRANAMTGTNSLEVGLPFYDNYRGAVKLECANDFSGSITVHEASSLYGYATSTGHSFGGGNAAVVLRNGLLYVYGGSGAKPVIKNELQVIGDGALAVDDQGGVVELSFGSYSRLASGTLVIQGMRNRLGGNERVKLLSGVPPPTHGMVHPSFVTTNAFLTYTAASGFSKASFTSTETGIFSAGRTNGTEIVNVTGPARLSDNPSVYALRAANAVRSSGNNDTLTVASGGLILNNANYTSDVHFVFGRVSGASTALVEALVYTDGATARYAGPEIAGTITAAGLTKFGPGWVRLTATNWGKWTGPLVINGGTLALNIAQNLGHTNIVLNGGQLYHENRPSMASPTNALNLTNINVRLGPLGGTIGDAHYGINYYGGTVISDQTPGDAGPLRISGYHNFATNGLGQSPVLDFSGGLIIGGSSWFRWNSGQPTAGSGLIRVAGSGSSIQFYTMNACSLSNRVCLQHAGSRLVVARNAVGVGALEGQGQIIFGDRYSAPVNLTLSIGADNGDGVFYGQTIELPDRSGALVKVGAGVQELWGNYAHSGGTTVSNGTLLVHGWLNTNAMVRVCTGGRLGGTGTVGPVLVDGGTVTGDRLHTAGIIFTNHATLRLTITGPTKGSGYVPLAVDGGVHIGSDAALAVDLGFEPIIGQQFVVIENGGGAVQGMFAESTVRAEYDNRLYFFTISYNGGDGNDIVLTVVPTGTLIQGK